MKEYITLGEILLIGTAIGIFILIIILAKWKGRSIVFHIFLSLLLTPFIPIIYLLICKKNKFALILSGEKQTCPFCFQTIDSEVYLCTECNENLFLPKEIQRKELDNILVYSINSDYLSFNELKHRLLNLYSDIDISEIVTHNDEKIVVRENSGLIDNHKNGKPYFKLEKKQNFINLELYKIPQPKFFNKEHK